jgi:hypothetical protein
MPSEERRKRPAYGATNLPKLESTHKIHVSRVAMSLHPMPLDVGKAKHCGGLVLYAHCRLQMHLAFNDDPSSSSFANTTLTAQLLH